MAGYIRLQVSIPQASTVPADACVNTWYFQGGLLTPAAVANSAITKLTTFYQAIDGVMLNGATTLSPATVKAYDLTEPEPRVPIDEDTIILAPGVGAGYPTEVAVCLSFQGARVSGQNQARRRGRVYLGPLDADAGTASGGRVVVTPAVTGALATAASALEGGDPDAEAVWSVFSPTTAGPPPWSEGILADAFAIVTDGWVDNAFDTQRRRGSDSTIRTTWT